MITLRAGKFTPLLNVDVAIRTLKDPVLRYQVKNVKFKNT